ncbi:DUF3445 domain-containing protein [Jannaschia sp. W003]|uniref:heme-dependent oxidative N-demethylase family protein n=1 Tax=Jannaschia sp. W003 TaxID=2867012 RepID=UPI0021A6E574|nr:DUF3445 domain-containing protein [Jannaschia sp. W003]UWQ20700.1 DUF3445 domain-containing protein [Jannaschia sp. W003]
MILQTRLPFTPWSDPALARMPGMLPVEGPWVVVDEAYAAQMAERARLVAERPAAVMAGLPGSEAAQAEALEAVLAALPEGFVRERDRVHCPDGRTVAVGAPLPTFAALVQEDMLVLERDAAEWVLRAGLLCFPASWTLAEKIGRPMGRIHAPVPSYDAALAAKVARLFDRAPPGRPMWRANALGYRDAALHQPRTEAAPKREGSVPFLRCERQTVLKLPRTGAILFAVHTWVVRPEALTPAQREGCPVRFAA